MSWKFWEKDMPKGRDHELKAEKLPKPSRMPPHVGQYLVVNLKKKPSWAWNLSCALRKIPDRKKGFNFRVFDDAEARGKGLRVTNYDFFDNHQELILYEGWFDKQTREVVVKEIGHDTKAAA